MSDTTPDTPAAGVSDESTTAPETESGTATEESTANTDKGGNSEAAKYRTRLREVEAERDGLTARLSAAQRSVVDSAISNRIRDTDDFWARTDLASLLDDNGDVSREKITAAVDTLLEAKPHYKRPGQTAPERPPRDSDMASIFDTPPGYNNADWAKALRGGR